MIRSLPLLPGNSTRFMAPYHDQQFKHAVPINVGTLLRSRP
jgi:hypothetical protein